MKVIKKFITILTSLAIALFQTGCWDQKIYEKIGFILQLGLELDENGNMLYSVEVPVVSPDAAAKTEVLTATTTLMREGRDKVRLLSGKTIEGGKTQNLFFSEDLAHKGIDPFLEIFLRSPENPLLANVIVVEGSPKELMSFSKDYNSKPRPTFYVNGLLESAHKNSYTPETLISDFTILTHSKTIDPITPLLRYNEKEIQIAGAALFNGDRMVGKLNTKDTGLLHGLMNEKKDISYIYQGPYSTAKQETPKKGVALLMRTKKRKIKINIENNKPVIDIKLDFNAFISEYSGDLNLLNPENKTKLQEAVSQSIQKDFMKILEHLMEVRSDPIGFGEILRAKHNQYWKSINWKDVYSDANFKVEVNIELEFYGAITNL